MVTMNINVELLCFYNIQSLSIVKSNIMTGQVKYY